MKYVILFVALVMFLRLIADLLVIFAPNGYQKDEGFFYGQPEEEVD